PPRRDRAGARAGPGGDAAGGVLPDGAVLLGGLQRVALPAALGRRRACRAPGPLGVGRVARRARVGDALHRAAADGPDRPALPLRPARGPRPAAAATRTKVAAALPADALARMGAARAARDGALLALSGPCPWRRPCAIPGAVGMAAALRPARRTLGRHARCLGRAAPA